MVAQSISHLLVDKCDPPKMPSRDKQGEARYLSADARSLASSQRKRPPISGAIPGFFGSVWRRYGERQKTRD